MTDTKRRSYNVKKRLAVDITIGGLAIVAVIAVFRSLDRPGEEGAIAVDFDDVAAVPSAAETSVDDERPPLRFAVGAMASPQKTRQQYDELLHLIAERVHRRALLAQRKTYAQINDMVERREVDVAFVCSAPYVAGKAKFGMELLVVPVMCGRKTYHCYIIVHRDSPLERFDDLKGKLFAYTDPGSNTGRLVPEYMCLQRGETPQLFFADTFYTYSHDNSIRAVAEGMADGAAVDSLVWEYLHETDNAYTAHTRIVEESPPYGMPPVVVHPDLDPEEKRLLKHVFLNLHEDEEARNILGLLRIDRFEEADDAAYDSIRDMQQTLTSVGAEEP